jgi:hypothetical protein
MSTVADKPVRQAAPAAEPQPKLAGDTLAIKQAKAQPGTWPAVEHMREGAIEMIAGCTLFTAGAIGLGLAAAVTTPMWVPIAAGDAAVGGLALATKGAAEYSEGSVELVIDFLLAPFRFFGSRPAPEKK